MVRWDWFWDYLFKSLFIHLFDTTMCIILLTIRPRPNPFQTRIIKYTLLLMIKLLLLLLILIINLFIALIYNLLHLKYLPQIKLGHTCSMMLLFAEFIILIFINAWLNVYIYYTIVFLNCFGNQYVIVSWGLTHFPSQYDNKKVHKSKYLYRPK